MDFAAAIQTASATLGLVKSLKDLDHALDKGELKLKMAELYGDLADVKIALVDAHQLSREKDEKICDLQKALEFKSNLIELQGFKYDSLDGKPDGLPYCPTCEVREGKLYRLAKISSYYSECHNCGKTLNAGPNGCVNQDGPQPEHYYGEVVQGHEY